MARQAELRQHLHDDVKHMLERHAQRMGPAHSDIGQVEEPTEKPELKNPKNHREEKKERTSMLLDAELLTRLRNAAWWNVGP